MPVSYALRPRTIPILTDPESARIGLERWRERAAELSNDDADGAAALLEDAGC